MKEKKKSYEVPSSKSSGFPLQARGGNTFPSSDDKSLRSNPQETLTMVFG